MCLICLLIGFDEQQSRYGLKQGFQAVWDLQICFLYKSERKPPRKREILIGQVEFAKIISIGIVK
jgi:hypothetical protein